MDGQRRAGNALASDDAGAAEACPFRQDGPDRHVGGVERHLAVTEFKCEVLRTGRAGARQEEHGDDERPEVHMGETDYTSRWLATTRVMISSSPTAGR